MTDHDLIDQWKEEEQKPFQGWDFSHLKGRFFEPNPPYSYDRMVRGLLSTSGSVLDMGTGGGEKLADFIGDLPGQTVATEGWLPNLALARKNLEPLGIRVVSYDAETSERMPFPDGAFSLVINRHEAFDPAEVARILQSGGVFVTQQVIGPDFSSVFESQRPHPDVSLTRSKAELESAGLAIEYAEEAMGRLRFSDVGAFVYFARAAPWDVPTDFSVGRYADQLLEMHKGRNLTFPMGHFVLQARKP